MPTTAGPWTLVIERGTDWTEPLYWEALVDPEADPDDEDTEWERISISGYQIRWQIRKRTGTDPPLFTGTITNGGVVVTNAAQGEFELVMSYLQTAELPKGLYQWDLLLISPAGKRTRLLQGPVEIDLEQGPITEES